MNDMENLRTFADQLWKYMVPKLDSKFASNVSYFRAEVVSNPGNNKLEVQRPVENGTLTLPCVRAMSGAQAGQQVVALVMGSMSNAIIVGDGKLNVPGGGGDAGIANFQAQPDGSLVITLTDGTTFTATPVINAFANVKVGSTTIAADSKADTLTLVGNGLVSLTGNATNDSVTISVDPNHTHITTQVLDLVNADSYGPSGMVSFDADVAEVPLKNCIVNIEPVQAGSGTPSPTNVRAISGWTGAKVHISPTMSASAGRTVSVDWSSEAGTVYGGTLDALKGTLTVDRAIVDLGDCSYALKVPWGIDGTFQTRLPLLSTAPATVQKCICSRYMNVWNTSSTPQDVYNGHFVGLCNRTDTRGVAFYDPAFVGKTGAEIQAALAGQKLVYPLETPITYQLSPQIISTLLGTNNIWADCGTISIDYGAFLSALDKAIEEHSDDDIRHITETDRETWDSKADSPHTHDASDIVSGILPAARGGTGNGNGYIQIGQKAGTTIDSNATAEGDQTTASGVASHAEGWGTTAEKFYAHAEGQLSTASGMASHAEGYKTTASGPYSHAEGNGTTASGSRSHAEGNGTAASGPDSHAEGCETVASGDYSHAEGYGTIAAGYVQHVFGKFNISDTQNLEIVGFGNSDTIRSNVRTLSKFGDEWIAGTLTQASDARLKDVQGEIPDLSKVRAVRFRWKNGDDKEHLGYLAQDVERIAPYLVDVDSNGYKSLDYIALLTAKVEMLEREVMELKGDARD